MGKSALSAPGMNSLIVGRLKLIFATPIGNHRLPQAHADLWATGYP